jgi:NADPH-dependent 2,4-dienoyl-CoA reductase/sulfur reductase-like enzyme
MRGVLGTSIVRVCGMVAGGTGLTEKLARRTGVEVEVAYNIGSSHAGYYPGAQSLFLKLVYDPGDGRLLGAQAVGPDGVDKRLDILATAIYGGMTLEDIEQLDLCYAPPFGSAKDAVILTGMAAANTHRGISPSITPSALFAEQKGNARRS